MKKIMLILTITTTVLILFLTTDIFIPSEKEIENPKQLQIEFCEKLLKDNQVKDSLFLISGINIGICGNDHRFNKSFINKGIDFFNKRIDLLLIRIRNPYTFNFKESTYNNNKTVIIGNEYRNILSSNSLEFDLTNKKSIQIHSIDVEKDTVKFITSQKRYVFFKEDSNWKSKK